jgi:DMSO/TMAO reductase YedYZ molybdopterin-dependent catalytic subunit
MANKCRRQLPTDGRPRARSATTLRRPTAQRGAPVGAEPPAPYLMAHCDGGYTTNLPLEDLLDGKGLVATRFDGEPLAPEHGGPARLLVPHLYFWKSAKWVRRLRFMEHDGPGFWELVQRSGPGSRLSRIGRAGPVARPLRPPGAQ